MTTKYLLLIAFAVSCTHASKPTKHSEKEPDRPPSPSELYRSSSPAETTRLLAPSGLRRRPTRSDLWQPPSPSGLRRSSSPSDMRPASPSVMRDVNTMSIARILSSSSSSCAESSTKLTEMNQSIVLAQADPRLVRLRGMVSLLKAPTVGESHFHDKESGYQIPARALANSGILIALYSYGPSTVKEELSRRFNETQVNDIMKEAGHFMQATMLNYPQSFSVTRDVNQISMARISPSSSSAISASSSSSFVEPSTRRNRDMVLARVGPLDHTTQFLLARLQAPSAEDLYIPVKGTDYKITRRAIANHGILMALQGCCAPLTVKMKLSQRFTREQMDEIMAENDIVSDVMILGATGFTRAQLLSGEHVRKDRRTALERHKDDLRSGRANC